MRKEITEIRCDRCGHLMEDPHTIEIKNAHGSPFTIMKSTDTWNYIDLWVLNTVIVLLAVEG